MATVRQGPIDAAQARRRRRGVRVSAVTASAAVLLVACSSGGTTSGDADAGTSGPEQETALACEPGDSPVAASGATDAAALRLPEPTGPEAVGTTQLALIDRDRMDPLAPEQAPRELVVQIWYPTDADQNTPGCATTRYQSAAAAAANEQIFSYPEGSLDTIGSPALLDAPIAQSDDKHPVVLYAHGLYGALSDNTAVALQLASNGYVVVAMGSTYESPAIQFPDGRVLETSQRTSDLLNADEVTPLIDLRAQDAGFVLAELSSGDAVPAALRESLDLERVAMFGHSAGGAAALQLAHERYDVVAAVNLDGFTRQPDAAAGLDVPFVFVTSEGHTPATEPSWPAFLDASDDGLLVEMTGVGHLALTDVGSDGWIDGMGLREIVPPAAFATNFGELAPGTMAVIAQGITGFLDRTMRDGDTDGFEQLAQDNPQIIKSLTPVN